MNKLKFFQSVLCVSSLNKIEWQRVILILKRWSWEIQREHKIVYFCLYCNVIGFLISCSISISLEIVNKNVFNYHWNNHNASQWRLTHGHMYDTHFQWTDTLNDWSKLELMYNAFVMSPTSTFMSLISSNHINISISIDLILQFAYWDCRLNSNLNSSFRILGNKLRIVYVHNWEYATQWVVPVSVISMQCSHLCLQIKPQNTPVTPVSTIFKTMELTAAICACKFVDEEKIILMNPNM